MIVDEARKMLGVKGGSEAHKRIIDYYNEFSGRPRGYTATYDDNWCMIFATVCAIKAGIPLTEFPAECGCQKAFAKAESVGCNALLKFDSSDVESGDLVMFGTIAWKTHVGIVERIEGDTVITIEGNTDNMVGRRSRQWHEIVGIVKLKNKGANENTDIEAVARAVIAGAYGNGDARKKALEDAGYSYDEVQAKVNELLNAVVPETSDEEKEPPSVQITFEAGEWYVWVSGDCRIEREEG